MITSLVFLTFYLCWLKSKLVVFSQLSWFDCLPLTKYHRLFNLSHRVFYCKHVFAICWKLIWQAKVVSNETNFLYEHLTPHFCSLPCKNLWFTRKLFADTFLSYPSREPLHICIDILSRLSSVETWSVLD